MFPPVREMQSISLVWWNPVPPIREYSVFPSCRRMSEMREHFTNRRDYAAKRSNAAVAHSRNPLGSSALLRRYAIGAAVAQLVERLIRNQQVRGSNPLGGLY